MLECVEYCKKSFVGRFETTVGKFGDQKNSPYCYFKMDDRARVLYEAENDQLIGRIIELERVTSVLRLVQTLIVLLEWLILLLEDIRISRNSLDIIAMLKDNLLSLEAELQRQSCEVREQILARYHRALQG